MRSAAEPSDGPGRVEPDATPGAGGIVVDQAETAAEPLPPVVAERLGQLAHDLRNPLNSIAMNTELITLVAGEGTSPEFGESLGALERAVEELGARLNALDGYVGGLAGGLVGGQVSGQVDGLATEPSPAPGEAFGDDER